jgi:predicted lipid-binding transport protein (Tim44 family)
MVEWRRRLDDFDRKGWHNRVAVINGPEVEYVGLLNREDDSQDRVVVRIEAMLEDYVVDHHGQRITRKDSGAMTTTLQEYWTLARRSDAWIVVSIEQKAEGDHHLEDKIVAVPWHEDELLRDDTLVEQAVADKALDGFKTAELADFDLAEDARAQALDLSLADGRFAPDVLEATVRRAVAAWADAVDGDDAALEEVATTDAVRMLLHPHGERTRVVVRGPQVERLRLVRLDAAAEPATMTVEVDVRGRRYDEDRDTAAVISGSQSRESRFTERWTLALAASDETPWRIVDGAASAADLAQGVG